MGYNDAEKIAQVNTKHSRNNSNHLMHTKKIVCIPSEHRDTKPKKKSHKYCIKPIEFDKDSKIHPKIDSYKHKRVKTEEIRTQRKHESDIKHGGKTLLECKDRNKRDQTIQSYCSVKTINNSRPKYKSISRQHAQSTFQLIEKRNNKATNLYQQNGMNQSCHKLINSLNEVTKEIKKKILKKPKDQKAQRNYKQFIKRHHKSIHKQEDNHVLTVVQAYHSYTDALNMNMIEQEEIHQKKNQAQHRREQQYLGKYINLQNRNAEMLRMFNRMKRKGIDVDKYCD